MKKARHKKKDKAEIKEEPKEEIQEAVEEEGHAEIKEEVQEGAQTKQRTPLFHYFAVFLAVVVIGGMVAIFTYAPSPVNRSANVTLEQKSIQLEADVPLAREQDEMDVPRWMLVLILGFIVIQILPLLFASYKAHKPDLTREEIRQIEFLAETPLFLGLLGSLLGVSLTQFISGSLSAPLAYLTTISGILLFLLGRFTILVSLPLTQDTQ